jgi:hypothetical protein
MRRSIAVDDDGRQETDSDCALCKLHNFCIVVEDHADSLEIFTASNESIPSRDELSIVNSGGVWSWRVVAFSLKVDRGQHFDDVTVTKEDMGNSCKSSIGRRFPPYRRLQTAPEKLNIITP